MAGLRRPWPFELYELLSQVTSAAQGYGSTALSCVNRPMPELDYRMSYNVHLIVSQQESNFS